MYSDHQWLWQHPDWPVFVYDHASIAASIASAKHGQGVLLGKASAIGLEGLQSNVVDALTREAVTTSTIEGETLNPQSVRASIAKRLGLDVHGAAAADQHIEGLVDVLHDASTKLDEPLSLARLCAWHGALFPTGYAGMQKIEVAALRRSAMQIVSGPVGKNKIHFQAPPAQSLAESTQGFVDWFNASHPKTGTTPLNGIVRASISHLWFETLHPFDDGNGRIGRAILQLAIGQDMGASGRIISLSRQLERQRKNYYQQLEQAQSASSMDITPWLIWMIGQIGQACDFAALSVDISLARIRFLAKISQVTLNPRQRKSLAKLLEAGPVGFDGAMTTRKHASLCKTSKPSAARDLIEMASAGVVLSAGAGRSTRYYLAIEGWGELPDAEKTV